jgi:hypothetical protein
MGDVIPDAITMLTLAETAYARVQADTWDLEATVSCALMTYHLADYAPHLRLVAEAECPYWSVLHEIAQGTKHKDLNRRRPPGPDVASVKAVAGFGQGGFGSGPFGVPYYEIGVRHEPDGEVIRMSNIKILGAAVAWWRDRLADEQNSQAQV